MRPVHTAPYLNGNGAKLILSIKHLSGNGFRSIVFQARRKLSIAGPVRDEPVGLERTQEKF